MRYEIKLSDGKLIAQTDDRHTAVLSALCLSTYEEMEISIYDTRYMERYATVSKGRFDSVALQSEVTYSLKTLTKEIANK